MPDTNNLKQLLKTAALVARKTITEQQLEKAAQELAQKKQASANDLRVLGESVASDAQIFAATDIDDINNELGRLREK